ncbi:MAG: HD domain-containing protein [Patescibacteria group bacterium]|nr:HD domain-containing protein [Patescibacteria group bacterium]
MINNRISRAVIQKIEKEAKAYFRGASGCHDWSHVERVLKLALHLGRREKADLGILEVAALLHDIGRREEMKAKGAFCHAEAGSALAQKILGKYKFNKDTVRNIIHCIRTHRFRDRRNVPKTIEAKALFDADKLDSIGAVGLGRAFLFAGGPGSGNLYTGNERHLAKTGRDYSFTKEDSAFLEYEIKLKKIKDVMLTASGRRIALGRHRFMVNFWQQFWQEVEGRK